MGRREQERQQLKLRAVADLAHARTALSHHTERASLEFAPGAIISRSIQKHRAAWIIGAAVAGVVALRFVLPSRSRKNRRDNFSKSDRKGTLSRLLSSALMGAARKSAFAYAANYFQNYLKQQFQPPVPERDDTTA